VRRRVEGWWLVAHRSLYVIKLTLTRDRVPCEGRPRFRPIAQAHGPFAGKFRTTPKLFRTAQKPLGTTQKSFCIVEKSLGTTQKSFRTTEKSLGTAQKSLRTTEKSLGTAQKPLGTGRNSSLERYRVPINVARSIQTSSKAPGTCTSPRTITLCNEFTTMDPSRAC